MAKKITDAPKPEPKKATPRIFAKQIQFLKNVLDMTKTAGKIGTSIYKFMTSIGKTVAVAGVGGFLVYSVATGHQIPTDMFKNLKEGKVEVVANQIIVANKVNKIDAMTGDVYATDPHGMTP